MTQRARLWQAVAGAVCWVGCAGPVEVLRESADPADRIAAARELAMEPAEGRVEALASALNDDDEGVRVAAAKALGALGPLGRAPLVEALVAEDTACVAAPVLGGQVVKNPEIAKDLDPTVGTRHAGSCVVRVFEGLGAATHEVIMEALLSEDEKRRKRAHYLACRVSPPLTESIEEVLTGPDDGRVETTGSALAAMLERAHPKCAELPEKAWRSVFDDPSVRHRAVTVVAGHPRRAEMLEPLVKVVTRCIGPDALLLAMDGGYSPMPEDLDVFKKALDLAKKGDPEIRCPTVDPDAMIATLLDGGLTAGSLRQSRGRLDMIERLGWKPDTTRKRVYVRVIRAQFAEAAKLGPPAVGPLLEAVERWKLTPEQGKAARAALVRLGDPTVTAIEERLKTLEAPRVRDDLIGVVQSVLGAQSPRAVGLAARELESVTDDAGIITAPDERRQRLTAMIRSGGPGGAPGLSPQVLSPSKPTFRALLFELLVEADGRRGPAVMQTIGELLDSDRTDLLVTTAASHLATAHPKGAKARIVSSVKSGGMTPGDGRLLAGLMANDAKGTAKLVGKLVKKVKNPEDFTAVAETLAEVGVYDVAFKLSSKAIKRLGKLSGKAAKSGDSKAGIQFSASASRMHAVLDRSALGMFGAATDESESPKKRLKALKKLIKSTKKVGLGGARKEVLKGLKAAAKSADSKKLKKAYKKAFKKLKKKKKKKKKKR